MEELFLCGFLTCDKLDIVNHQNVGRSVLLLELGRGVVGDSIDKLVNEGLALLVDDLDIGISLLHMVHNRIEKMGFTKTGVTVEEEGIAVGNIVRYGVANRLCKLVRLTLDEVVEGVFVKECALVVRGVENFLNFLLLATAGNDRLLFKMSFHILGLRRTLECAVNVKRVNFYFNIKADYSGQSLFYNRYVSGGENLLS